MVSKPKSISEKYLTFVAQANGFKAKLSNNACQYCIDESDEWVTLTANTYTPVINTGQMISFKANITPITAGNSNPGIGTFTTTAKYKAMGTPMSLIYSGYKTGNDFLSKNQADAAFMYLFKNDTYLTEVSDDFLPSMVLGNYCYTSMFEGCTSLIKAPKLPATDFQSYSVYSKMFAGCTSLKSTPNLPALTVYSVSYVGMFKGCTSLTEVCDLPATTIYGSAYESMFEGCTSLVSAPNIYATSAGAGSMHSMFKDCTSLVYPPSQLYDTNLSGDNTYGCYQSMFSNCINLKSAPIISAKYLGESSLQGMFYNCKSLTTAPDLKIYSVAIYSLADMFENCTSLTSASNITIDTDTSEVGCCWGMFSGCTSLVTGPNILTTTLRNSDGALSTYNYASMFYNCKALSYVKALFLEEPHDGDVVEWNCLYEWMYGVRQNSSNTIILNSEITWDPDSNRGKSGIPYNWTVQYA